MEYHVPVMVEEVIAGLMADPSGMYIDATAGGGGHSMAMLHRLGPAGRLVAVDRDGEAVEVIRAKLAEDARVSVYQGSFAELGVLASREGIGPLCGALFDLGVSSHQIEKTERGFSYREDGPLDMRMDAAASLTAAEWIAESSERELADVITRYGEERQARRIARAICRQRQIEPLQTTGDLRRAVAETRPQMLNKTLARVFQALRIAVNDELGQLQNALQMMPSLLAPSGRLAVISYHSLEDRLVKRHMAELERRCICPPRMPVCVCGHQPSFRKVGRKAQKASRAEVGQNSRARSAVLRLYEKIEVD